MEIKFVSIDDITDVRVRGYRGMMVSDEGLTDEAKNVLNCAVTSCDPRAVKITGADGSIEHRTAFVTRNPAGGYHLRFQQ